jgi:ligand-binding sensor domain-containing protein/DNA-binding CsgD family transcriptional regulator
MCRLLLLLLLPLGGIAQNTIGIPEIFNYSKQVYGGGLQSWDITQDKNGIIYLANNEGLLSYDGAYWSIHPLPNKTIVRSVAIATDSRIYVGGQDEIGYFSPSANGRLTYHSLVNLLPSNLRSFGDVWDIVVLNRDLYFRTPTHIFRYANDKMASFPAPAEWMYMGKTNTVVMAQDAARGLLQFKNDYWEPVMNGNLPPGEFISAIVPTNADSSLVTTLKNGLYDLTSTGMHKINNGSEAILSNSVIYGARRVNQQYIALATSNSGAYIIDRKGNIIQQFGKTEGLQNKNVLSIFGDARQNIWLGLDNGIDMVAFNSAIKQVNPLQQDGSGYTALLHNGKFYAGTSGALYSTQLEAAQDLSFSKANFKVVTNSNGQTWKLASINGQVLLGHHDGAYLIQDNTAIRISSDPGFWNFVPLTDNFPSPTIISGNYRGLSFFDYNNGSFKQLPSVPGFSESSRFVAIDSKGAIWVSQPYHGIYKIVQGADTKYKVTVYDQQKGLPSTLNNHIYKIKNEVVAATERGVYNYNEKNDRFEPSEFYTKLLGNQSVRYLKEDSEGNIWFIHDKSLGVIDLTGKQPKTIFIPELSSKLLSGFEFIYPVDSSNIFLGAEKGFFHINYPKYKRNAMVPMAQLRMVRAISDKDSLLFGGYFDDINEPQVQPSNASVSLPHGIKTLRFEFSSPVFGSRQNTFYSFRLKGLDDAWSEYGYKTDKEYTNLPAGNYRFEIKTKNNLGQESAITGYSFSVSPPWYATIWAAILYFLIALAAMYLLYRWLQKKFRLQKIKYEEEQKRLLYIHELEMNKNESELMALRNDKLESEISYKNSELASSAMHLVKKAELLTKVKSELGQVIKVLDNPQAITEIKKMMRTLNDDDKMDQEWENFTKHFDKVHSDFVVGLKEKHPGITGNELKLSAYLRMNLSTKEIAQLMNISVRGVEISRYRLRKKLQLPTETSLFDYLINIQPKS